MREACGGRASARCGALAQPSTLNQRVGAAPLARSTPTLPTRA
ncbi:MAG: hypothetical protein NZ455_10470 [Bacteroidia bacterium]|nr:hypothetical protein [Bacteroidia bacterium]MDW8346220.1 hypothetical protein [Bacteroidia bacterium]